METVELLGEAVLVATLAGWIGIGVIENIRFPGVNGDLVAMVMRMDRVKEERPEIYEAVKGNRVESPALHAWAYRAIVAVELLAAALLTLGTAMLVLAAASGADPAGARAVAAAGSVVFALVWGGFLVGGQWFHYWAGWKDSQFTHFFLVIWGALVFQILV